jgi:hypothetical protein
VASGKDDDHDDCGGDLKKIPNPFLLDSVPRNVFAEIKACLTKCIEVVDNRTMLS